MLHNEYDVLIVGAGIAGSSFAHALSNLSRPEPLRIALLERSLAEPDRIVGEYLQPGGYDALKRLGLESCVEGIDAVPSKGYCVLNPATGNLVHLPYPEGHEGRSFHHGRLVTNLRNAAHRAAGVDVIEATVTDLIEDKTDRVIGVYALRKNCEGVSNGRPVEKQPFYASLVVIADGCLSNLRAAVMGPAGAQPITTSQSVGVLLKDVQLPVVSHALIALPKGCGPVTIYQISTNSTRMLINVKAPIPSDIKSHILKNVVPHLPTSIQIPAEIAVNTDRLRRMPNSFLPPVKQGAREGVVLLGDSWNMRHPSTGGGMTVALNDVIKLCDLINSASDLKDWSQMKGVLHSWHWKRKPISSTINVMSLAIDAIFSADDEDIATIRDGCLRYLECREESAICSAALLSGINPSLPLMTAYFFDTVIYTILSIFIHPSAVRSSQDMKLVHTAPRIHQYPFLFVKALRVFWKGCAIICPLVWSEIRWWAPMIGNQRRNIVLSQLALPLLALMGGLLWTSLRVV